MTVTLPVARTLARNESDDLPTLHAVILYDDIPAGRRALQMLGQACGQVVQLAPRLWRLDLLADLGWRELATAEVVDTALLVVAASSANGVPEYLDAWLATCLAQKPGIGAVATLIGTADHLSGLEAERIRRIKQAAREAGLVFFEAPARGDDFPQSELDRIHFRAESMTPTLDEILHHHSSPFNHAAPERGWGINE